MSKKTITIIVLLVITGIISWNSYFKVYLQKDTVSIHEFPFEIGEWKGESMEIKDYEYEILETKNAFVRKYTNPAGAEVYLFIVYSQFNRKVSHPPEICYTGGGNLILDKHSVKMDLGDKKLKAQRLLMEYGKLQQISYYWFKVGTSLTNNYWKQQGLIALKSLLGQPASSALIRVSTVVEDEDIESAEADIKSFTRQIMPLVTQYLP